MTDIDSTFSVADIETKQQYTDHEMLTVWVKINVMCRDINV